MKNKAIIPLLRPHLSGKEITYIEKAIQNNWVAPVGENILNFEQSLEKYLDNQAKITAVNSGTSAIHLALILLGIQPGDEVICQSLTFIASVNPVLYQKATPIFVDSEVDSWNICPYYLEKAIKDRIKKGKKPKAIIAVHLYGMPYKYDEILDISKKYNIPIVEDAAESLGSIYKNKKCGTMGDISALSFNGNKIITCSAGGAVVTSNNKLKEKAFFLSTQAKEKTTHYEHKEIGYNYRLSNISAGIGLGQMEVIDERVKQKRALHNFYEDALRNNSEITLFQEYSNEVKSNFWINCIQLSKKASTKQSINSIIDLFKKDYIEVRPIWKPMHLQPLFKDAFYYGENVSESLFFNGLCLPSATNLKIEEKQRIKFALDQLQ